MRDFVKLGFLSLSVCLLSACGGGGGGGDSSGGGGSGSTAGISPTPALSTFGSYTVGEAGSTLTQSLGSGFEGDIEAKIVNTVIAGQSFPRQDFKLANGMASLNIVDIQRVQAVDFDCNDGSGGKGTLKTNFVTGVELTSGSTDNGQSISCSSTYQTVLPATVTDNESIRSLLIDFANFDDPISTTCPDDEEEEIGIPDDLLSCTGVSLFNFVITDDTGKTHRISTQVDSEIN